MIRTLLIGAGAGLVCTVLYASVASGSPISVVLFYLAPLPLYIVFFGWGTPAGLTAVAVASLAGLSIMGPSGGGMILLSAGLPAAWLGRLTMMWRDARTTPAAQPGSDPAPQRLWYPVGRLIIWCAGIATALVGVVMITMGGDIEKFQALAGEMLRQMIAQSAARGTLPAMPEQQLERLVAFLVWLLPVVSAVIYMVATLLNMWLAGWVTRRSGLLQRPAPQIKALSYPRWLMAALFLALIFSLVPGFAGLLAAVAASTIIIAYALQGLAVIHVLAANTSAGPMVLVGAYALLIFFNWLIVLALSAFGLAESVFFFRRRIGSFRGDGTSPDNT